MQCPNLQVYHQRGKKKSWNSYCQEAASLATRRGISLSSFNPNTYLLTVHFLCRRMVVKTRPKWLRQQKAAGFHLPNKHWPAPVSPNCFHFFPPMKPWWEKGRKEQFLFSISFYRKDKNWERRPLTSPKPHTCQRSSEHQSRSFETRSHLSWQSAPPGKFYRLTTLTRELSQTRVSPCCDLIREQILHVTTRQGYWSGCEGAVMGTRHPHAQLLP